MSEVIYFLVPLAFIGPLTILRYLIAREVSRSSKHPDAFYQGLNWGTGVPNSPKIRLYQRMALSWMVCCFSGVVVWLIFVNIRASSHVPWR